MLSLPDFKEKQILFIIPQKGGENKIRFWNDNIRLEVNDKPVNQLSCYKIFAVFIIGDFTITSRLIQNCREYGISIFLLKNNFEVYAEINSAAEGNYLLRSKQYHLSPHAELAIAKQLVKNKISNQFFLVNLASKIKKDSSSLLKAEQKIEQARNHQELLGIEGSLTRDYFALYFKEIGWYSRLPRAKPDIPNVLMDIGYTFLFNFIDALLCLYGFDTYKGIYHKLFFQRKSLACDLMEPFRCLIDRQILKSYRLKQIDKKDFLVKKGQVLLSYDKQQKYLQIFADCLMKRKEEIFKYVQNFYYHILNNKSCGLFFKIN
ncbi:MAG: type V CRISPR-associated endonuclease Cas1 [Patescibacteria group bacterium]